MAETTETATGVLGGLPPLPRKPLNNSVIAAEQAYRRKKGLPEISEADMEALRQGQPMSWEPGGSGIVAAPAAPAQPAAAAPVASAPAAVPAASVAMSNVQGGLPNLPRKALNNSVISAEQAYRKKKGILPLSDVEVECLKQGVPMPWEPGGQMPVVPAATGAPAAPAAASPAAPAAAAAPSAPMSNVQGGLPNLPRKALNNSVISAEQAYRKKKGIPALNEVEIYCLKQGVPMPWEPGGTMPDPAAVAAASGAPAAVPAAAAPAAPAAQPAARAAAPVAAGPGAVREGAATRYVGTPAVGTSQAAAAAGVPATGPENSPINIARRRLVWSSVGAFLAAWFIAFFRFFMPRTLFEPSTVFKIGYPSDYGLGVDSKWQQKYRIWVDRTPDRLFVIYARCTHLGCTPDWKPAENKFKCPCHGSGYDSEAINFEGPAPRPMDRAHVELDATGQIVVDTSRLYQQPKGQPTQFNNPGAFLSV
jgi:cytochrome b6-f complex iron-sulfur subunit